MIFLLVKTLKKIKFKMKRIRGELNLCLHAGWPMRNIYLFKYQESTTDLIKKINQWQYLHNLFLCCSILDWCYWYILQLLVNIRIYGCFLKQYQHVLAFKLFSLWIFMLISIGSCIISKGLIRIGAPLAGCIFLLQML